MPWSSRAGPLAVQGQAQYQDLELKQDRIRHINRPDEQLACTDLVVKEHLLCCGCLNVCLAQMPCNVEDILQPGGATVRKAPTSNEEQVLNPTSQQQKAQCRACAQRQAHVPGHMHWHCMCDVCQASHSFVCRTAPDQDADGLTHAWFQTLGCAYAGPAAWAIQAAHRIMHHAGPHRAPLLACC